MGCPHIWGDYAPQLLLHITSSTWLHIVVNSSADAATTERKFAAVLNKTLYLSRGSRIHKVGQIQEKKEDDDAVALLVGNRNNTRGRTRVSRINKTKVPFSSYYIITLSHPVPVLLKAPVTPLCGQFNVNTEYQPPLLNIPPKPKCDSP